MNKDEALNYLYTWEYENSIYEMIAAIVNYDKETSAPSGANTYRSQRIADFAAMQYEHNTGDKILDVLNYLKDQELDEIDKRKVYLYLKEFNDLSKVPIDIFAEYQLLLLMVRDYWHMAKDKEDYKLFGDKLKNLIFLTKRIAELREPNKHPYDVLLNDFEEGTNIEFYDKFFDLIKKELLPLIDKVNKAKKIDDSFLYKYYPSDKQKEFIEVIKDYVGFDKTWGSMGISVHPFTTFISNNDCRITTNFKEYNIGFSIASIIHEIGHAYYGHQVEEIYDGTILKKAISSGAHESESRFFENYLAKRESFIKKYFYKLKELFSDNLKGIEINDYIKAINASKPSLIRVEADELTYPIHILIRYEIEKRMFSEDLDIENLDELWNEYYEKYLGIKAHNPNDGILQDMHWSGGMFGYFPTYALGSAVAAQLFKAMEKDINIDEALDNNFKLITDWLKDNFQKYGALYSLNDLLIKATGEAFNPQYYIDYLKDKYTKLYNL